MDSRAAGKRLSGQRSMTGSAGLAGSAVDVVLELKSTASASGVDVVSEGGAATAHRATKQGFHAAGQRADLTERQRGSGRTGMEFARMEKFIDVNIAQSCDKVLIQQCGFERTAGGAKSRVQHTGGDTQRIRPEPGPARLLKRLEVGKGPQSPEASRVGKRQPAAIMQMPDDVNVMGDQGSFAGDGDGCLKIAQRSAHAKVNAQAGFSLEGASDQGQLLAVTQDVCEGSTAEQGTGAGRSANNVAAQQLHTGDAVVADGLFEREPNIFDFGQFRHGAAIVVLSTRYARLVLAARRQVGGEGGEAILFGSYRISNRLRKGPTL